MNLRTGKSSKQRDDNGFKEYTERRIVIKDLLDNTFKISVYSGDLRDAYKFEDEILMLKSSLEKKIGVELDWHEWEAANSALMRVINERDINKRYATLSTMLNCALPEKLIAFVKHMEAKQNIPKVEEDLKKCEDVLGMLRSWLMTPTNSTGPG